MYQFDSLLTRNARAQVHATLLAGGSIRLYDGAIPTGGGAVTTQVLLASWTLPNPAGAVDAGEFVLTANLESQVLADGIPTWARLLDSTGALIKDMDAGGVGSDACLIVSPAQLYAGGTARIVRMRLIEPV